MLPVGVRVGQLLVLISLLAAGHAVARPILQVSVDRDTVQVGGSVRLTVQTQSQAGDDAQLVPPELASWRLVGKSQSSGYDSRSRMSTSTLRLTLQPSAVGALTIGAFALKSKSETIRSNPITITVTGPGGVAPGASNLLANPNVPAADAPPDTKVFLQWEINKREAWMGEELVATLNLYVNQRVRLSANSKLGQLKLQGFWKEDIQINRHSRGQRVVLGGLVFNKQAVQKLRLFPIRAGTLELPPVPLDMTVRRGAFGGGGGRRERRLAEPLSLKIKSLPRAGRPASYRGLTVGRVKLNANLNRSTVKADDGVQLTITTEIVGRITAMPALKIPHLPHFKVFPPTLSERSFERNGKLHSRRLQTWLLRPEKGGTLKIPAQRIGYFDPVAGRYAEAKTRALSVRVLGTPRASRSSAENLAQIEDGDGIALRTIHKSPDLSPAPEPASRLLLVLIVLFAAPMLFGGVWFRDRHLERRESGAGARAARSACTKANTELDRLGPDATHGQVARVLVDYLQVRTGEALRGLTRPQLARALRERGVSEQMTTELVAELENADFARFAPAGSDGEVKNAIKRARRILKGIEEGLS